MAARSIKLSIIVPVLNEAMSLPDLFVAIEQFEHKNTEVIFVDGGSSDDSLDLISVYIAGSSLSIRLIESAKGRSTQQNAGAEIAQGNLLLFLHADTILSRESIHWLENTKLNDLLWGRFNVSLYPSSLSLKVVSWFINRRSRLTGIATGDQAIFVSRALFDLVDGFPDQALMEDVEISRRLKMLAAPACCKQFVTTSSRKWLKHGVVRTVLLMWRLRAAYFFGAKPESLHKRYYQQ